MRESPLYKVLAGRFYMLDADGCPSVDYKKYTLFRNTYGLVFLLRAATNGRCWAAYFARGENGWDVRTVFPIGKIVEEENRVCIKTRYNTFVWDSTSGPTKEQVESLFQWVKVYGEDYIPGLTRKPGVQEWFERTGYYEK